MPRGELPDRITHQYSYQPGHGDIWRVLDRFIDTHGYLNLGYSSWYQPHFLGSSQRRLTAQITARLLASSPPGPDASILDVGCGRGGPSLRLSRLIGGSVTGVDLVPYNISKARANAHAHAHTHPHATPPSFIVGNAETLPFRNHAFTACTAVDSIVYMPDKPAVFSEIDRVLSPDGILIASDLVTAPDLDHSAREAVSAFATWWDMPPLVSIREYQDTIRDAGLTVRNTEDVTRNSVGRFRKYTAAYRALGNSPVTRRVVDRILRRWGASPERVSTQVQATHHALPHLRHIILCAAPTDE